MKNFDVFKEIVVGGVTKEQLLAQLTSRGIQFNKYAHLLFEHPFFVPPLRQSEKLRLAKVTLDDFELKNPSSYQELVRRAQAAGLSLCPLYLAAFLRLQFLDQPEGPHLTVASAKPKQDPDFPNGFYIRNREGALWLRGYRADDECEWPENNEFIFLKR